MLDWSAPSKRHVQLAQKKALQPTIISQEQPEMQIRRITTAESNAGVDIQVDDLTETGTRKVFDP